MNTKKEIIDGVIEYAEKGLLPVLKGKDKALSMIIYFLITQLKIKPKLADIFFENPFVKMILPIEDDEMYDIDSFLKAIKESVKKYGGAIAVTIPPIPLLSPAEKELKFDESDIDTMLEYINPDNGKEEPEEE